MVGPDTSCTGTVEVIADVPLLRLFIETWDFKNAETERTLDKRKQSVKTKSEKNSLSPKATGGTYASYFPLSSICDSNTVCRKKRQ